MYSLHLLTPVLDQGTFWVSLGMPAQTWRHPKCPELGLGPTGGEKDATKASRLRVNLQESISQYCNFGRKPCLMSPGQEQVV